VDKKNKKFLIKGKACTKQKSLSVIGWLPVGHGDADIGNGHGASQRNTGDLQSKD